MSALLFSTRGTVNSGMSDGLASVNVFAESLQGVLVNISNTTDGSFVIIGESCTAILTSSHDHQHTHACICESVISSRSSRVVWLLSLFAEQEAPVIFGLVIVSSGVDPSRAGLFDLVNVTFNSSLTLDLEISSATIVGQVAALEQLGGECGPHSPG